MAQNIITVIYYSYMFIYTFIYIYIYIMFLIIYLLIIYLLLHLYIVYIQSYVIVELKWKPIQRFPGSEILLCGKTRRFSQESYCYAKRVWNCFHSGRECLSGTWSSQHLWCTKSIRNGTEARLRENITLASLAVLKKIHHVDLLRLHCQHLQNNPYEYMKL
jgi:hypothetical protein